MSPRSAIPRLAVQHSRATLDAVIASDAPTRAFIVGNAGSGKSALIGELHALLSARGAEVEVLADQPDPAAVPPSTVLLVDDLQLLAADRLAAVAARASDPHAGLVVAARPWPRSDAARAVSCDLERSHPPIVLGHVSRSDLRAHLEERGQAMSPACVEHVLEFTEGVAWLVEASVDLHDDRECADDPQHTALRHVLEERIAHRVDVVSAQLRLGLQQLSLGQFGPSGQTGADLPLTDDFVAEAYSEGLLLRNGRPVPLVSAAVRATIPVQRLADTSEESAKAIALSLAADPDHREWIDGIIDPRIGDTLIAHADRVLDTDPQRAASLYRAAVEVGADPAEVAARQARAAWAVGDLDAAATLLDAALRAPRADDGDLVADTAAAAWAARGMMSSGSGVYRALPPLSAESKTKAMLTDVGVGSRETLASDPDASIGLSTLTVSMQLLDRGLRATLTANWSPSGVTDLVRASELYSASPATMPIPELPAVLAAIAAVGSGDLETAYDTVDAAIGSDQGGQWARPRLLLWKAWIEVQRERPVDARAALEAALEATATLSPRDEFLLQSIRVAIARRYDDLAGLTAVWQRARGALRHVEMDLYLFLPLTEVVSAAARVGDTPLVEPHFAHALRIATALGPVPLWTTHLHWAGIQQGILLNQPESLAPHARALVAAAAHSRVAETMAQAGRVWTSVLAGSVDPDAVESAARALATAGLAWDGARLAGHGAGRTDDRRVSARLLSCARELHPRESRSESVHADSPADASAAASAGLGPALSERERDVARLVLQGKTYAEIGAAIFISPRTAEHHIAHIRRRLGATSRSDLIAKLRVAIGPVFDATPVVAAGGAR
ncbi:LuxR C-terminal-related transcriptional regulator [Microbacterium sp. BWT-B31]|uniref:LuxR C-terminal-related transcriptional regulator n=1 Tax=Microbacterium sp. BWT-B31 TaxID=3232072 RepID=UPI00352787DC